MIRQFIQRLGYGIRNFMVGRYGTDKLNMAILCAGLAACLISAFVDSVKVNLLLTAVSYGLGAVPQLLPQYLQALSGEPEVPPVF